MKNIYLTRKQVAKKKEQIDKIVLDSVPYKFTLEVWLSFKKNGKPINKNYEKAIDKEVVLAKKALCYRIEVFNEAEGKKKLLDTLLKKGTMISEDKKYILKD